MVRTYTCKLIYTSQSTRTRGSCLQASDGAIYQECLKSAVEKYILVALFIMLYTVILTLKPSEQ